MIGVDLGQGSGVNAGRPGGDIRAEMIRAVLLGLDPARPGSAAGLNIRRARVTGPLDLAGITVTCPVIFEDCEFGDEVRFAESVTRSVRFTGCRLPGFDGARMRTEGVLDFSGCVISQSVRLEQAKITGQLSLQGAVIGPGPVAVSAAGLSVVGGVTCAGMTTTGSVRMEDCVITGSVDLAEAVITSPGPGALDLGNAQISGRLVGRGIRVDGEMLLHDAHVTRVELSAAQLHNPSGFALSAGGLTVSGGMFCTRRFTATGAVWLVGARLSANLALRNAELSNPGKVALNLTRATIGDFDGAGMTCTGRVTLNSARVSSGVDLAGARLDAGPSQVALDLGHASIGVLRDDPECWPESLNPDGLTYQALEPQLPADQRLRWLARRPGSMVPQPYEQLASYYTGIGQPAQARRVQLARERLQRSGKRPLARTWSFLQDVTVGYGYRPWRAVLWLGMLLAAGSSLYAVAPPPPLQAGAAPHFNAVIYTLDLLLPVVDLGQKHAFNPAGAEQWFSYFLTAAGWVLASTIAAGVARVLNRG
jgi:hypothetical protein